jgi:hypothetical protein
MASERTKTQEKAIRRCLSLVTEAMDLLDAHSAAPAAAAHLAFAHQQLRQSLAT